MELLVVISIIGVLASIILASLGSARVKARDAQRKSDIHQIQLALQLYYTDYGVYPTSGGAFGPNGFWSNSNDPSWATLATALAPYIKKLPQDPQQTPSDGTINIWPFGTGIYSYTYYGYGCTAGAGYMIVWRPESGAGVLSQGVTLCGTVYNYGNGSITTGISGN